MKFEKIKEKIVTNIYELFTVITETIVECKSTQIFISNVLMKRLLIQDKDKIIWEEFVVDSFCYCDKIEKAIIFKFKNNYEKIIFQMNFVEDNLNYIRLTFFGSKSIYYHHYLTEMKIILIINSD